MSCGCKQVFSNCKGCEEEGVEEPALNVLVTKKTPYGDKGSVRCAKAQKQFPNDNTKFCERAWKANIRLTCAAHKGKKHFEKEDRTDARMRRGLKEGSSRTSRPSAYPAEDIEEEDDREGEEGEAAPTA